MGRSDNPEPAEVVDRLLWRDAQQMLRRHAGPGGAEDRCQWCGWRWPCPARRLAERADAASRRPWHDPWPAHNDNGNLRPLPGGRAESSRPANSGLFD